MSTVSVPNIDRKITTAAGWVKQALHTIVLPSGAVVKIRIPDISDLIQTGQIPQHLLADALAFAKRGAEDDPKPPTPDEMKNEVEFKNLVVKATVVEPAIDEALLVPGSGIPVEDKDMIVEFAMRQREFDAEGNHIGGLDTSAKYRRFRGIDSLYEDVEGVSSR